ncbi:transcription-associated protein 1 [Trichonephila clavipes]|nr:transcription-associated protein 1 [Trichonephila clavipes]
MARQIPTPNLGITGITVASSTTDPVALMNTYRSYISMIVDPTAKDESKLKALQEVSQELETISTNPQYPQFLDHTLRVFIKILQDGEPHFISEHTVQIENEDNILVVLRIIIEFHKTFRPQYSPEVNIQYLKWNTVEMEPSIERLNSTNYNTWKEDVPVLLMDRNSWRIITGQEVKPDDCGSAKEKHNFESRWDRAYSTI